MRKLLSVCLCVLFMLALSAPVYAAPGTVPDEGLILYLSFDNDSGTTVKDQSSSNKTVTSASVTYADGKAGKAVVFNGTDSTVEFTNTEALTDISVSFWVKAEKLQTDGHQLIAGKLWANGSLHCAYNKDGYVTISFFDWKNTKPNSYGSEAARYYMNDKTAFDGKWLHVAFTYDNAAKHRVLYLNGIKVYESDSVNAIQNLFNGDYELGCYTADTGQNGRHFKGMMDEFRVYNKALSQDDVTALAAQGGGPEMEIPLPTEKPEATPTKAPTQTPTASKTAVAQTTQAAMQTSAAATPAPKDDNTRIWIIWVIIGTVIIGGSTALIINRKKK